MSNSNSASGKETADSLDTLGTKQEPEPESLDTLITPQPPEDEPESLDISTTTLQTSELESNDEMSSNDEMNEIKTTKDQLYYVYTSADEDLSTPHTSTNTAKSSNDQTSSDTASLRRPKSTKSHTGAYQYSGDDREKPSTSKSSRGSWKSNTGGYQQQQQLSSFDEKIVDESGTAFSADEPPTESPSKVPIVTEMPTNVDSNTSTISANDDCGSAIAISLGEAQWGTTNGASIDTDVTHCGT